MRALRLRLRLARENPLLLFFLQDLSVQARRSPRSRLGVDVVHLHIV